MGLPVVSFMGGSNFCSNVIRRDYNFKCFNFLKSCYISINDYNIILVDGLGWTSQKRE